MNEFKTLAYNLNIIDRGSNIFPDGMSYGSSIRSHYVLYNRKRHISKSDYLQKWCISFKISKEEYDWINAVLTNMRTPPDTGMNYGRYEFWLTCLWNNWDPLVGMAFYTVVQRREPGVIDLYEMRSKMHADRLVSIETLRDMIHSIIRPGDVNYEN